MRKLSGGQPGRWGKKKNLLWSQPGREFPIAQGEPRIATCSLLPAQLAPSGTHCSPCPQPASRLHREQKPTWRPRCAVKHIKKAKALATSPGREREREGYVDGLIRLTQQQPWLGSRREDKGGGLPQPSTHLAKASAWGEGGLEGA